MSNTSNPAFQIRSDTSIFQIEIFTRRSVLEGFTWILGTNQFGDILNPGLNDPSGSPFTPNKSVNPYVGLDAVSVDTSMHIDPSGRQSPNTATVTINENVLVYAQRSITKTESTGSVQENTSTQLSTNTGSTLESLDDLVNIDPSNRVVRMKGRNDPQATKESGADTREATGIIFTEFSDQELDAKSQWIRFKKLLETELEPDDRIIIKTLSHTLLSRVKNWQDAMQPIFTGYITEISTNGSAGSNEQVVLSCKDNLYYCEISKFNIAPAMCLTPAIDQRTFRGFGQIEDVSLELAGFASNDKTITDQTLKGLDALAISDQFMEDFEYTTSTGVNELVNETATSAIIRLLTQDAFETCPILTIQKQNGNHIQYYLQSGITTNQVSYNNFLGPSGDNYPFLENRPLGAHGRIETVYAIPFFNQGGDVNSSMNQYLGEWNTVLELCGQIANNLDMEFFADECGRMVFKFPTHGVGMNLLPDNDFMPNILAKGAKIPYIIEDRNILQWDFKQQAPVCTVIKASAGVGIKNVTDPTLQFQNAVVVRFNGLTLLGNYPIGGGENLISKYGVRAQVLAPTDVLLAPTVVGSEGVNENKLLRSTLAQYAIMKGEIMNDIARFTGSVTAVEDSVIRIGQPIIIEKQLQEGDFGDFGFPQRDFYYVQGINRNLSVGNQPTMTLDLTVGRRYPELSGYERAYFSFWQYIARKYPGNQAIVFPDNALGASEQAANNFGETEPEAFFTFDSTTNSVKGPDKAKLTSITGDKDSDISLFTRKITKRVYQDLLPLVNDYTKQSAGFQARLNNPQQIFTRPARRVESTKIKKAGDFELIIEPLIKINSASLPDVFPEPQAPVSQIFQGYSMQDAITIYNDNFDIA